MYLRQKPADVCGLNCEQRHPGCHATCERYLDFHEKRRAILDENTRKRLANSFTTDSIRRCREGTRGTWKKYRPQHQRAK